MKNIIELKNVWKTYKMGEIKINALQGIDLTVKKGEFLAVMGPSGSGKSTAMNMIGCLDVPTKGNIFLDGKDISHLSESQLALIRGKKIGFIFQQFNLINTLTAKENVMLPMMFQGTNHDERERKTEELLALVDLRERMSHRPTELSGGQQQRVAIARSLANNPEVILADEPTGNLDSRTGEIIMHFLEKLNREENKTIVVVTHDENIANAAQRIAHLRDGKIIKAGRIK
ncbi:MAG TPA: ABC transporter ATP-binding protein [Candidatus Nanoarchaeia archaeon]|nr:ABC transporter ATP-binding protein [Candidatus Nanoarchaeia archaeon]